MLTIDGDKIKLDNVLLPGVVQSISVGGSILYEKQDTDTTSTKRKVMLGYEDKSISISLTLYPESLDGEKIDVYKELETLEKFFKENENAKPKVYNFIHPHARSRAISKVLFQRLESSEDVSKNTIDVSIEFIEFVPAQVENISQTQTSQQQNAQNQQNSKKNNQNNKQKPKSPVEEQEPKIDMEKIKKGYEVSVR